MLKRYTLAVPAFGLIGISILLAINLFLSGGSTTTIEIVEPVPAWRSPTLADIYDPFETLATDIHDYIWPTDVSRILTSTFGEFRSTHFHAGIDISTHGRIGAPVYASRRGYVEQVGVSPFGYGKYILMRHEDGFRTLYAHLDQFHDAIEERVYEHQLRSGRYSVILNFEAGEFQFQQGEQIALSGSTGSGPPHIHFEIRDENNNPVNPKFSNEIWINDRIPPTFNRIAVIPVDAEAFVNNRITPMIFPATAVRADEYVVGMPIQISGTVGLAVDLHDRNNDTWYRHGIYGIEFFLGDSLIYELWYDRFPIAHRQQVRLHYDHYLLSTGRGRFRKLFIEEGNVLPFYNRRAHGSGLIRSSDFEPGAYEFTVIAHDLSGNSSRLKGTIIIQNSPFRDTTFFTPRLNKYPHRDIANSTLTVDTELFRNKLIVTISHPNSIEEPYPLVAVVGDRTHAVPLFSLDGTTVAGRVALVSHNEQPVKLYYLYNDSVYTHTARVYSIQPDRRGEIILDDSTMVISYDYGSVYYPIFFKINTNTNSENAAYTLHSTSSVLDKGIRLTVRVPDEIQPFDRTVLYTRDGSRWITLSSDRDAETRTITGSTSRLYHQVRVAADTVAPVISNVLVDGNRNMRLRFRVLDTDSGIDHSSLRITLDEMLLIGRYDPDHGMVIARVRDPLQPGSYDLAITVRDRAGNESTYQRTIHIR